MKFYIASSFQNRVLVSKMASEIQNNIGWEQTYDWTKNERAETVQALGHIGIKEFDAVMNSEVVIVILPGGKGCHTELGIALGANKNIFLYDPEHVLENFSDATTFYYLPQIKRWNGSIKALKEALIPY